MAQKKSEPTFGQRFVSSATAACIAEAVSLPFDTAKVRMQLQGSGGAATPGAVPYKNVLDCVMRIAKEESPASLWKGLTPGLQRQIVFTGLRVSLYKSILGLYHKAEGDPPLLKKIAAGLTSGALSITVANPTDVVKVRLQAEGRLPEGAPRQYNGSIDAYKKIIAKDGVTGLWRGYLPNVVRNSVICAAELATYDQIKQVLLATRTVEDGLQTHLISGVGAGFVATVVGSPVDVIKTRVMNTKDGQRVYSGIVDCVAKSVKTEGFKCFYKGFWANFSRIGTWNVVMFASFEQIQKILMKNN